MNEYSLSTHHCFGSDKKPVEIYLFIDPISPECWALEPMLKKLKIEYGRYFSIKYVLSGNLATLNLRKKINYGSLADSWRKTASRSGMSCDGTLWLENPLSSPYIASIAIKAAELQGRKAGYRFLRKLQEALFLGNRNITDLEVLKDIGATAGLDLEEFMIDLHSDSTAKAFQCDLKITAEMEVQEIPTFVFFNENIEEEGIKITGAYPYTIYVQILEEMLSETPRQTTPPPLETFLKYFRLVASKEIAVVYDMPVAQVEREMKKLMLKHKVEKIPAKYGAFWKYIEG